MNDELKIELLPVGSTRVSMRVLSQPPGIERGSNIYFDLGDVCLVSLAGPEISTKMRANTIMIWTWGIDPSMDSHVIEFDFMTMEKRNNAINRINDCVRLYNKQE